MASTPKWMMTLPTVTAILLASLSLWLFSEHTFGCHQECHPLILRIRIGTLRLAQDIFRALREFISFEFHIKKRQLRIEMRHSDAVFIDGIIAILRPFNYFLWRVGSDLVWSKSCGCTNSADSFENSAAALRGFPSFASFAAFSKALSASCSRCSCCSLNVRL